MTHAEFVAAWREEKVRVTVSQDAASFVSARLLLPFLLLPVFGIAVAIALVGYVVAGLLLFVAGLAFRFFVRRSAPGFVLQRAIASERFYDEARARGLLHVEDAVQDPAATA